MSKRRVYRVLRSGSVISAARSPRTTNRYWDYPERGNMDGGFRIVVIRRKVP